MLAPREALSPRRDLGFLFDLLHVDSRLELQELDLSGAELLALRAILLEPLEPEHFRSSRFSCEALGILRPLRECPR
jgi:hypothetical protein